jgi:hypothetical protein
MKYPKMMGKNTNTGLYKKHPMPKTKNPARVAHLKKQRMGRAVTKSLSS